MTRHPSPRLRAGLFRIAILTFAALAGSALAAGAAVYHVSPSGSDANSGLSIDAAWRTIARANSRVAPGDVVMVHDGTYGDFPSPGVSGTASQRITYVGNLAFPSAVRITGGSNVISKSHVTIKGFELAYGFVMTGVRDSLAYCNVQGNKSQLTGADDCVVTRSTFDAKRFWVVGSENDSLTKAERDTISFCTFNLAPNEPQGHTIRLAGLESCVFNHCAFRMTIGPEARGGSVTKLFFVRRTQFIDCSWDVTNNCFNNPDEAGWFVNRDFTQFNHWVRDTIIFRGPAPSQFFGSASGSYPGTVMDNTYEYCVFKADGPLDYDSAFFYQNRAYRDTLRHCVIVGSESGLGLSGIVGDVLVDRCTIVGFDPQLGAVSFVSPGNEPWIGNLRFTNNIVMTALTARRYNKTAPLWVALEAAGGKVFSDHNVFHGPATRDSTVMASVIGPSAPGPGTRWCNSQAADCNSVFGTPAFADPSDVIGFDAHLLNGSWAIGTASDGGDVGAYPFSGGPDTSPPGAVADLVLGQLGDQFVTLVWTAPGDDGAIGRAAAYDVRWSSQPITDANFASATPLLTQPDPQNAGAGEEFTVLGLSPGTQYHFALRAVDEAGNWSGTSNDVAATTHATDQTPPAAIQDLRPGP